MKKLLKKTDKKELYYFRNGEKQIVNRADRSTYPEGIVGKISDGLFGRISSGLTGNINGLHGNCSGLTGDCSGITGKINSEVYGDISGLYGYIGGITGDISDCELTDEEREKGVNIQDLVQQKFSRSGINQ